MNFKVSNDKLNFNVDKYSNHIVNTININMNTNNRRSQVHDIEEIDYSTLGDSVGVGYGNYTLEQVKKLDSVKQAATNDSQINTDGKFANFTDIQNVMLSDFSLLELLFEGADSSVSGKTIAELYMDSLNSGVSDDVEYDKLQFDGYAMLDMSKEENWDKYRSQVLGKLVRYGFADLKITKKITGEDGFSAFILEDTDGNQMVYFPCTNLVDSDDFLYDSYPIMASLPILDGVVNNVPNIAESKYKSQQEQASNVLEECIKNAKSGSKVSVSGFSLGGSLAENSYLNSYGDNSQVLGDIVLFNPYHDRLSEEEIKTLKDSGKLKLYVCEGDSVSTVFNYEGLSDVAKTIYIDYERSTSELFDKIDNNNSIFNLVVNEVKNQFCDDIIVKCNEIKGKKFIFDYAVDGALTAVNNLVERGKNVNLDAISALKLIDQTVEVVSPILDKFGIDLDEKYNLKFLDNLHYLEFLFVSTHLTYTVDPYKNISFDENGSVKDTVVVDGEQLKVSYPSFGDTMEKFLGSDPYEEVTSMLSDVKHSADITPIIQKNVDVGINGMKDFNNNISFTAANNASSFWSKFINRND